jgi:hypothetical protein
MTARAHPSLARWQRHDKEESPRAHKHKPTCENYNRRHRQRRRQQQRNEHNNCGVAMQVFLITPPAPCNEQYPHYVYDLGRFFPLAQLRIHRYTRVL